MDPIEQEIQDRRKDLANRMRPFVSDRWILARIFDWKGRNLDCQYTVTDETCAECVDHLLAA